SEHCEGIVTSIDDYNIQKLANHKWLLTVANPTTVTTICPGKNSINEVISENSLLTLESKCTTFVGTTRNYASIDDNETIIAQLVIPDIQFDCCSHLPEEDKLPKLKPLQINHLNLDELNVAEQKLREFDDDLNRMVQEPFVSKHWDTLTYFIIGSIILIIIWLSFKCGLRRKFKRCCSGSNDDDRPSSGCCSQIFN